MAKPVVKIKFTIPPDMLNGYKALSEKMQDHMVRQAVRSAVLPARRALKSKLMALGNISPTSSGASMRALDTKVRKSKKVSGVVYGIVSINRRYFEAYTREEPVIKQPGLYRQVSLGSITGFNRRTGQLRYAKKFRIGEVRSTLRKNTQRRHPAITHAYKRWPKNYWHLSEYGFYRKTGSGKFAHSKSPASFAGHRFVEKVYAETKDESVSIFQAKMREFFSRQMKAR